MRKILLVAAIFATATVANAQATFGVKGGVNFSNLKMDPEDDDEDYKNKTGFNIGAFAAIPLSTNFNLKPELVYSVEGAKLEEGDNSVKTNLSYVNIPVLFQYNASGFIAETGPQVGFLTSAKVKYDIEGIDLDDDDIKDDLKGINFSWAVGLGYQMTNGFGVNARYNFGLSNIADTDDDDDFKMKTNTIQIGISYSFGGGSAKK